MSTITLNGTALQYLPTSDGYGRGIVQAGPAPQRAIDRTLVDLGTVVKERWVLRLYIGSQYAFLKGLCSLASFTFIDHDGSSYTVKMTGLSADGYPTDQLGIATVTLEEV